MEHGVTIDRTMIDKINLELWGTSELYGEFVEAVRNAPPAVIPINGNYENLKWTMMTDGIIIGFDSDADMTIGEVITKE